jgi:hypothetical protein
MVPAMKPLPAAILPILLGLVLPCSPLACSKTDSLQPGETPPPPASTGAAATDPGPGSEDTASLPVACGCPSAAQDRDECPCPDGQTCAADYALGDPAPDAFTCRPDCIPTGDPLLWCLYLPDATDPVGGCCSGTCRPDGLCGEPEAPTTGDATTGTSTGDATTGTSTGDATTGSSTGSSTGDASTSTGSSTSTASSGTSTG